MKIKVIFILIVCSFSNGFAENTKEPPKDLRVTETHIYLPGVIVDRQTAEARIEAKVVLNEGVLEYVVCKPNDFDHETIFVTEVVPEVLHTAILLLGASPAKQMPGMTELWYQNVPQAKGSHIRIDVEWTEKKEGADEKIEKRVPLFEMLRRTTFPGEVLTPEESPPLEDLWIFAGSFLVNLGEGKEREYAGNFSGIHVGIWPEMSSVIQYGKQTGNPYGGNERALEAYTEKIPPLGTPVKLVFYRLGMKEADSLENEKSE